MQKRILVVEDNEDLANLLDIHLKDELWDVDLCLDGKKGFKNAQNNAYDLIILDIMLPGMDGLEILKKLRGKENTVPILMLTSKSSEIDRILGLEFGADDYVTKPFSIRELIARVKAIFRRIEVHSLKNSKNQSPKLLKYDDLTIDHGKRKVVVKDKSIDLTAKEFDLLYFFASNPGQVFNRAQLLDRVWGYGHDGYEHTVNSNINRLRAKIETDPAEPEYILTVWGVGYKFKDLISHKL
ncbi:MAG: response regulator transcription factor [Desulfobacteraceae bacterium]|nr:response regulator transcription factor [Desulfobacteraceae bacterium]